MKYRTLVALIAIVAFAACRQIPNDSNPPKRGLFIGNVRKAPISPIERPGVDNSAPLAGAPIRITGTSIDTLMVSDTNGRFYLWAAPGAYAITAQQLPDQWPTPPPPSGATIRAAFDTVTLNITYETHIR